MAGLVDNAPDQLAPWRSRPIDTAKSGMPCRKFVVPSSGSTMHNGAGRSVPATSPPSSIRKE